MGAASSIRSPESSARVRRPGGQGRPAGGRFGGPGGPAAGAAGRTGRGRGGPGGPGGPGGGRATSCSAAAAAGRTPTTATANYTFGGSALDSVAVPAAADTQRRRAPYTRQNFGVTVGGPVQDPRRLRRHAPDQLHVHLQRQSRRPTCSISTRRCRPTRCAPATSRRIGAQLIDPQTGLPFAGNQIPPAASTRVRVALLRFIPPPNLPGTTRNYHYTTTTDSLADNVNLRVTHNFTPAPGGARRWPARRRGGRRGGRGGPGGRGGRGAATGTTVLLNAQLQYRAQRQRAERTSSRRSAGRTTRLDASRVPVSLEHRRTAATHAQHQRQLLADDVAHGQSATRTSRTSPATPASPASRPIRSTGACRRCRSRASRASATSTPSERAPISASRLGYTWTRPIAPAHAARSAATSAATRPSSQTDANARGTFVFTGLYASGGVATARGGGLDFADFLLGLPQQAAVQYGPGNVDLRGRSMSLFVQDDWRKSAGADLQPRAPLRAAVAVHRRERPDGQSRRDAGLHRRRRRCSPARPGPYTGAFPRALMHADANNIAPRVGVAWRAAPGHGRARRLRRQLQRRLVLRRSRGSWSAQPPFAVDQHRARHRRRRRSPSTDPLATAPPTRRPTTTASTRTTRSAWSRRGTPTCRATSRQVWNVGAGYTHTRGSSLDIVRAPNRGPDGLRIADVQPFLWQTSEGSSVLHAGDVPRCAGGRCAASAAARPTRWRGRATTPRRSAAAARSSRRTTRTSTPSGGSRASTGATSCPRDVNIELPFGPNRRWLNNGGALGGAARGLARHGDLHLAVGHAAHAARHRRRRATWRAAPTARCAPTTTASAIQVSTIRRSISSSTPRRSRVPATGTFGNAAPQHDHRPRQPPAERAVLARRPPRRHARAHAAAERHQPAQHGQLRGHRHRRQLADVRPGARRCGRCARCSRT